MIAAGHTFSDVADYSLDQVEAFLTAIGKQEAQAQRTALIVARAAKAKQSDFNKIVRELDK